MIYESSRNEKKNSRLGYFGGKTSSWVPISRINIIFGFDHIVLSSFGPEVRLARRDNLHWFNNNFIVIYPDIEYIAFISIELFSDVSWKAYKVSFLNENLVGGN
ncbi:hypothetical protein UF75_4921 [Desulfosporosinus sp. I2]|nr:hypothetical protein UF75_4921 [Desulfosporosinus sp. I2]